MVVKINSAAEVINSLGGNKQVAIALGKDERAVSMWKMRRLPAHTFLTISELLRAKGLYAPPSVWGMDEPKS